MSRIGLPSVVGILAVIHLTTSIKLSDIYDAAKCGVSESIPSRNMDFVRYKIMGGEAAVAGEFPWAVELELSTRGGRMVGFCGGTLVSKRHVITAAHCFKSRDEPGPMRKVDVDSYIRRMGVRYGGICLQKALGVCSNRRNVLKRAGVRSIHLANFFGDSKHGNDVAIIELVDDVTTTHACLPLLYNMDKVDVLRNARLTTYGFGSNPITNVNLNNRLEKLVYGNAVDRQECGLVKHENVAVTDYLCVWEGRKQNVCSGDSGSGLIAYDETRAILIGVVSKGVGCEDMLEKGHTQNIQIYTDIRYHNGFISTVMGIYEDYFEF